MWNAKLRGLASVFFLSRAFVTLMESLPPSQPTANILAVFAKSNYLHFTCIESRVRSSSYVGLCVGRISIGPSVYGATVIYSTIDTCLYNRLSLSLYIHHCKSLRGLIISALIRNWNLSQVTGFYLYSATRYDCGSSSWFAKWRVIHFSVFRIAEHAVEYVYRILSSLYSARVLTWPCPWLMWRGLFPFRITDTPMSTD